MLIAVTALLLQFPLFSSQPNQAADKVAIAAAAKAVDRSTASNHKRDMTDRAGALTADAFPGGSEVRLLLSVGTTGPATHRGG